MRCGQRSPASAEENSVFRHRNGAASFQYKPKNEEITNFKKFINKQISNTLIALSNPLNLLISGVCFKVKVVGIFRACDLKHFAFLSG